MKLQNTLMVLLLGWGLIQPKAQSATSQLSVRRTPSGQGIQLHLADPEAFVQTGVWLELERSTDLVHWEELLAAPSWAFLEEGEALFEEAGGQMAFFRLQINHKVTATSSSGEEIFGFASSFAKELEKVGQLSVEEFL